MEPTAEDAQHDADHGAEGRLAEQGRRLGAGVPPGRARTRKKSTNGSASPSLRPDSRLSVWRTISGTRFELTTAEVTTGSVGARTAARRNASGQVSSVISVFAARAISPSVIGKAIRIARVTGPQCTTRSSRSTVSPSANSVRMSASSISSTIAVVAGRDRHDVGRREDDPDGHRQHRDREHGAAHQPRQRGGDREEGPEDEERAAEPDVHWRAYTRLRSAGGVWAATVAHRMAPTKLADDVVRLGTSYVNWYLVADDEGVTVVDAGVPGYRPQLDPGLDLLGRSPSDVRAVLLTHADGDHTGVSTALRDELGVPVHLHPDDAESAHNHGKKKFDEGLLPELVHPGTYRLFWHFTRNGGAKPPALDGTVAVADGEVLELPGRPKVIHTPGHTPGHVAYLFAGHGALFVGDLMCTWHPTRGRRGPQVMAFNVSTPLSYESLGAIEDVEAALLLPGHGEPWTDGPKAAVAQARETAKADGRV